MSCTNIIIDLRAVKAPFYIEEGDHFNDRNAIQARS